LQRCSAASLLLLVKFLDQELGAHSPLTGTSLGQTLDSFPALDYQLWLLILVLLLYGYRSLRSLRSCFLEETARLPGV
jgi:hypothetical protein